MKTSRKILIWITGAGAVFALTAIGIATIRAQADQGQGNTPAQAGPRRPGPGAGRGFGGTFGGGSFAGGLMPRVRDLTDAQREQMKAIADRWGRWVWLSLSFLSPPISPLSSRADTAVLLRRQPHHTHPPESCKIP